MVASETASQTSTRGEYGLTLDAGGNLLVNADVPFRTVEYGNFPTRGAFRAEHSLLDVKQSPWVGGEFVWTGFDYIGEPSYGWPARSSDFGIVDLCGFPKDRFYLYKASWTTEPVVHHPAALDVAGVRRETDPRLGVHQRGFRGTLPERPFPGCEEFPGGCRGRARGQG